MADCTVAVEAAADRVGDTVAVPAGDGVAAAAAVVGVDAEAEAEASAALSSRCFCSCFFFHASSLASRSAFFSASVFCAVLSAADAEDEAAGAVDGFEEDAVAEAPRRRSADVSRRLLPLAPPRELLSSRRSRLRSLSLRLAGERVRDLEDRRR